MMLRYFGVALAHWSLVVGPTLVTVSSLPGIVSERGLYGAFRDCAFAKGTVVFRTFVKAGDVFYIPAGWVLLV